LAYVYIQQRLHDDQSELSAHIWLSSKNKQELTARGHASWQ
jgi:hypothetical protein